MQMNFGKSRVQYNDFYWTYFRYERYDIYFNQEGKALAENCVPIIDTELNRLESFFSHNLSKRIIFIVYNKQSDFKQSNLGLVTGSDNTNIGGVTRLINNKVCIYYEGDTRKLREQIAASIAEVIINDILYGSAMVELMANSMLINLPQWYIKGLISYVSKEYDNSVENFVKDGIVSGRYKKFNKLIDDDAEYAGHSFWNYIATTYGESLIPNLLYMTRVEKSVNRGFRSVLGVPTKQLSYDWNGYCKSLYASGEIISNNGKELLKRPRRDVVYQHPKIHPSGKYLAYSTNQFGKYKIWLYDLETKKKKAVFRREYKLVQITDYTYPVIAWHPSGRILTFITEEKGGVFLYFYNIHTKELTRRRILYFEKILDFSFSDDGTKIVLSGVKNGQSDIYVHTIASGTNEQITNDIADDFNPRFIDNSNAIIFCSNRNNDTLSDVKCTTNAGATFDLFLYKNADTSKVLTRLSDYKYVNKSQPFEVNHNKFISLNDRSGVVNRYYSHFDSTINFIDTAIHYNYYTQSYPLSNYSRNIIEQDYSSKSGVISQILFLNKKYHMYTDTLEIKNKINESDIVVSEYQKKLVKELAIKDSMEGFKSDVIPIQTIKDYKIITNNRDTLKLGTEYVDINSYTFEQEKLNYYNEKYKNFHLRFTMDTAVDVKPKMRIYQTSFYTNYLVTQIDFTFLGSSYQMFSGDASYYNPGLNFNLKLGTYDLFENYKIVGGVNFSPDFESNEYILSVENLKSRLDKQIVYHRQAFEDVQTYDNPEIYYFTKTHTDEVFGVIKYPFNQVFSLKLTGNIRFDHTSYIADPNYAVTLKIPEIYKEWLGIKGELVFDNSRSLGINLYEGSRCKLFGEIYKQINLNKDDLYVLGFDLRHYIKIYRSFIWANRLAGSTSFGSSKLIYFLGGVDNWINLSSKVPYSIPTDEIPIDMSQNYVYKAVATNLRGFPQNIRNGNSFTVLNSELRLPIIKVLTNYPISSSFFENLQLVGFFDIGSAWTGLDPFAGNNSYSDVTYEHGPIRVIVDTHREPVVAGYGFGLRSQLLGYFVRVDWAWGIENGVILPYIFYLSLSTDF